MKFTPEEHLKFYIDSNPDKVHFLKLRGLNLDKYLKNQSKHFVYILFKFFKIYKINMNEAHIMYTIASYINA